MLPLSSYRAAGDPVLLFPGDAIPAAVFIAQAGRLAEALPGSPFVINLCETRHGFMLAFAAALVRGQISLLPPGRGRGDWEPLLRQFPDAYVLSEEPLDAGRCFDIGPFLANRAAGPLPMLIPEIDSEQTAAILFTSGSTGQPAAHRKSWGQLWRGAAHLAEALRWGDRPSCAVVGSVSPQHMFGLEATVMLPWHAGVPVHAHKPLLAADIEFALGQCARPCWWMTTAVQLRAPLQSRTALAGLEGILASTMSVPAELAAAAESAWNVPLMEIYGSTETGALAIRRTARESAWVPLAGVSLRHEGEGKGRKLWAAGLHVGPPVQLDDEIEFQPDGRFVWLGRSTDLVKVGGRRASLSALNRTLTDIPGVEDGVYCVPDQANAASSRDGSRPAPRLAAVYVSPTLSPEDVLRALRARVDPAFLPRPLYRATGLPRNAIGKLSQAALADLLAQCRLERNQRMAVPAEHPALPGHFPNRPIVPGVVILARVMETIRAQLPHVELGALTNARFHSPLAPGRDLLVRPQLQGGHVRFEVHISDHSQSEPGALIASGQWACRSKPPAGNAGA
jgi:hypothetical protein